MLSSKEKLLSLPSVFKHGQEKNTLVSICLIAMCINMAVPDGFDYQPASIDTALAPGSAITRIAWLLFLVIGIFKFGQSLRASKAILAKNRFFVGLLIITACSFFGLLHPTSPCVAYFVSPQ